MMGAIFRVTYFLPLCVLLLLSCSVRLWLIFFSGELLHLDGQEYFEFSQHVKRQFINAGLSGALKVPVFGHWGCVIFGALSLAIKPYWLSDREFMAIFFGAPAVINILLVYFIATRFFSDKKIAFIAACLYAISFSALYLVRAVQPNDLSAMFFLAAILTVLIDGNQIFRLFLAGLFLFLCFFVYYGYWQLVFLGGLFSVIHKTVNWQQFFSKGLIVLISFSVPLLAFVAISASYEVNALAHFSGFGSTISEGGYGQGYLIPFQFFWRSEGFLSLLWLAGFLKAIRVNNYAIQCCMFSVLLMYLMFVFLSNFLEVFAVYGRLVKAMVPMLCIISAYSLREAKAWKIAVLIALCAPGYLMNSMALNHALVWADINHTANTLKKKYGSAAEVVRAGVCHPPIPQVNCFSELDSKCQQILRAPHVDVLPFNGFDGPGKETRELLLTHKIEAVVMVCFPSE